MGPRLVQACRRLVAFRAAPQPSAWRRGNSVHLCTISAPLSEARPGTKPSPTPAAAASSTTSASSSGRDHLRELVPPSPAAAAAARSCGGSHKALIYCNRALNMRSISAVGFDLDYTLAQYRPETFELLAYQATAKKLVHDLGYPRQILEWEFDWQYMVRGLVLDKRRGNILKMDRHKYVKVAYHGFQELSREERMAAYGNTLSRDSYDEPEYALIDTLFSLAEAYLFAQLVELKDTNPELFPSQPEVYCENDVPVVPTYAEIYKDVRAAVDLCHRDGTLKLAVASNPSKYIYADEQLVSMLKMLRESGRLTFLVTNSLWDYTHVVMNYLFKTEKEWLGHFDLVVTGSAKPSFFMDGNQAPLFAVDVSTGMLSNTDNGTPVPQIGLTAAFPTRQASKVYQGGTVLHLHKLLAIEAGAQVLYCGDHIYGDILRSKKQLGTLADNARGARARPRSGPVEIFQRNPERDSNTPSEPGECRGRAAASGVDSQETHYRHLKRAEDEESRRLQERLKALQAERDDIQINHRTMQRKFHEQFHTTWGQLMKAGHQNSRFAHQVERFACLYTSQVTNLCCYSPDKCFRTAEDFMPHQLRDELPAGQSVECTL